MSSRVALRWDRRLLISDLPRWISVSSLLKRSGVTSKRVGGVGVAEVEPRSSNASAGSSVECGRTSEAKKAVPSVRDRADMRFERLDICSVFVW